MEAEEVEACKVCGGEAQPMGKLGRVMWFRCRQCGAEQHQDPEEQATEMKMLPTRPGFWNYLPAQLRAKLEELDITDPDSFVQRDSDVYVYAEPAKLDRLLQEGPWRHYSGRFICQVTKKPAVCIGLALLDYELMRRCSNAGFLRKTLISAPSGAD